MLLYSASNRLSQLRWVDRAGRPLGLVGEPGEFGQFRLAPDGRRVARASASPGGADVWFLEVERGVQIRFTSRAGINIDPIWSPDGQTVVFSSGPPFNLFRKAASGASAEERLTRSPNTQFRAGLVARRPIHRLRGTHHPRQPLGPMDSPWQPPAIRTPRPYFALAIQQPTRRPHFRRFPVGRLSVGRVRPVRGLRRWVPGAPREGPDLDGRRHISGMVQRRPRIVLSGGGFHAHVGRPQIGK